MHIFQALMADHSKVKDLLNELVALDDSDHDTRDDLVQDIRDELIPHSRAEESLFYNSLRALQSDTSKVMHGFKEHMEAEALLRALQVEDTVHLPWKKTAMKLKEALEHHIHEEETEIFAAARKVITAEEAEKLGTLFEELKPQIKDESFAKTSLEMVVNLLPPRLSGAVRSSAQAQSSRLL